MKSITASLLSCLAAGVAFAAADSLPTVYSYNQRDVEPLRRTKRTPIAAEPLQGRDAPPHYQSGSHLFPAIHPNLNRRDVQHLHKRQAATLFYSKNGGIYLKDADMVASIDATFHWEAVILDHSASIKNVTCSPDQMSILLDSPQSFQSAKNNWTTGETIVFVSSDKTCHTEFPGQYGYFNTSSVSFNSRSLTATAKGKQISADQAVSEFNVPFHYHIRTIVNHARSIIHHIRSIHCYIRPIVRHDESIIYASCASSDIDDHIEAAIFYNYNDEKIDDHNDVRAIKYHKSGIQLDYHISEAHLHHNLFAAIQLDIHISPL
ncbi:hypothetical protein TI39_contig4239g00007 [Zymoseptoria brevis]|uniref:DUF7029 domain-containing protein n=1 Tax=Zymoseptoria brevis TaxID=1047168 RepID=A0A0F4G938_9PEZI|nr:hypothetical protein TI39_contig4239g00007 [Zymoseptoria brevis]